MDKNSPDPIYETTMHELLGGDLLWSPPSEVADMTDPLGQFGDVVARCSRCWAHLTMPAPAATEEEALAVVVRQGWDVRRDQHGEHLWCHGCLSEAG